MYVMGEGEMPTVKDVSRCCRLVELSSLSAYLVYFRQRYTLVLHLGLTSRPAAYVLLFLCQLAVLNVGLGLFNLIPIPPLDGSRVVEMFLPERAYRWVLRYERYLIVAVVLLAWMGFFGGPLYRAMAWVLQGMCEITQFPFSLIVYNFF